MAKLDDVAWHAGGDQFPPGLPEENAGTHIGFFVKWAIRNHLWGDFLGPQAAAGIEAVRNGHVSGRQFLLTECDGKLFTDMLKTELLTFAEPYYQKQYMRDYQRTLSAGLKSDYLVEDTEANYDKLAAVVSQRYSTWRNRTTKPWWKFWWPV